MADQASMLGVVKKESMVTREKATKKKSKKPAANPAPKPTAGKADVLEKVDAISGATATYLKEEVVTGAAYTCYTMWHWANGDAPKKIRQYSQRHCTEKWLTDLLRTGSSEEFGFALEGIVDRSLFGSGIQALALARAQDCSDESFVLQMHALEKQHGDSPGLYTAYKLLLGSTSGKRRVQLL